MFNLHHFPPAALCRACTPRDLLYGTRGLIKPGKTRKPAFFHVENQLVNGLSATLLLPVHFQEWA